MQVRGSPARDPRARSRQVGAAPSSVKLSWAAWSSRAAESSSPRNWQARPISSATACGLIGSVKLAATPSNRDAARQGGLRVTLSQRDRSLARQGHRVDRVAGLLRSAISSSSRLALRAALDVADRKHDLHVRRKECDALEQPASTRPSLCGLTPLPRRGSPCARRISARPGCGSQPSRLARR